MKNFTIFLYHDIRTGDSMVDRESPGNSPYILDSESFRSQMRCLSKSGFSVVSLAELVQSLREHGDFEHPTICLTFDDGHVSNFTHAFPILREFGYIACFFLTVNEIGGRQGLSWDQVRSMSQEGMEIGSHGLAHVPMSSLNDRELINQLLMSKQTLEDGLGKRIRFFSSPTGYPDPRLGRLAKNLGYDAVCVGPVAPGRKANDLFALTRIDVKRGLKMQSFIHLAAGKRLAMLYHRGKEESLFWAKRCLGLRGYESVRRPLVSWKAAISGSLGRLSSSRPLLGERKATSH